MKASAALFLIASTWMLHGLAQLSAQEFRDVAAEAGLDFRFHNGSRGRHDLVEIMGGGVALFDADGDELLDVYACDGGPIDASHKNIDTPSRLYLNRGGLRFEDVTASAGAAGPSYAMGVAVGDYDSDGRIDLFVTGWRDQRLYRNLGGARFCDVTESAGLRSNDWSTSAVFADLDGDGDLDLYVCNYLDFDAKHAAFCAAPDGERDYCGPEVFAAQPDRLYRNNGDGTFTDVSLTAGIDDRDGRGLGVLVADFDADGRCDVYVANDGTAAFLWHNEGSMRFKEVAAECGVARDARGDAPSGMGVAWGDVDGDGFADLFVTNYWQRGTLGFRNLGAGRFVEASSGFGLGTTRTVLGFGISLCDFDGDGALDLLQANGHVVDRERLGVPLAMKPKFLRSERGRFRELSNGESPWFEERKIGRGLAVGDFDRDGRPDVVAASIDHGLALLHNESNAGGVTLKLQPRRVGEMIGTRVELTVAGCRSARVLSGGGSYLSYSPAEVHFGIGTERRIDRIDVTWPDGQSECWRNVVATPSITLVQGTGIPVVRTDSNRP